MAAASYETIEFGFKTSDALGARTLTISQQPSRAVAWKVYPGALLLCRYLEENFASLGLAGKVVLEVGAGVCGLPSLALSSNGVKCIATVRGHASAALLTLQDIADVLPALQTNLDANQPALGGSCHALPLDWHNSEHTEALLAEIDRLHGAEPALIVAAEVVYWEQLIDPLIDTLLRLTARSKPRIIMTYVQRFKRAKRFFKKVQKHFRVTVHALGDVVDYEALTWGPRGASVRGEGDTMRVFTSSSADHNLYTDGLPPTPQGQGAEQTGEDIDFEQHAVPLDAMRAYLYFLDRK